MLPIMKKEIEHTWQFKQSVQEVWNYLTKPELMEQWLMKSNFSPVVGHKFQFRSDSGKIINCEVLEVKPFSTISYSWQANSLTNKKTFDTKVVWTLIPKDQGTELRLVHNGFTVLEDLMAHENGWTILGNKFIELLKPI